MKRLAVLALISLQLWAIGCVQKYEIEKLHLAIRNGNSSMVKELLAKGIDPDSVDRYGFTPLCQAAYRGDAEIAKMLIDHGVDVNLRSDVKDGNKRATFWPLLMAVERAGYASDRSGHEDVAIMLIEKGAKVDLADAGGFTPLHESWFSERVTRMLVENGADIHAKNRLGETPLHFAIRLGIKDAVRLLLELGADPEIENNKGETSLDYAKKYERDEILKLITSFQSRKIEQDNDK